MLAISRENFMLSCIVQETKSLKSNIYLKDFQLSSIVEEKQLKIDCWYSNI